METNNPLQHIPSLTKRTNSHFYDWPFHKSWFDLIFKLHFNKCDYCFPFNTNTTITLIIQCKLIQFSIQGRIGFFDTIRFNTSRLWWCVPVSTFLLQFFAQLVGSGKGCHSCWPYYYRRGGDLHRQTLSYHNTFYFLHQSLLPSTRELEVQDARVRARAERVRNAWCGTVLPAGASGERLQREFVVAQGGCYFLGSHARGRFCHTIQRPLALFRRAEIL